MALRMKRGQELIGVDDGQLAAILRGVDVHAFRLQTRTERIPVGRGGHQDDTLAVFNRAGREATYGAVEKLLILIELNDVIAGAGGRKQSVPGVRTLGVSGGVVGVLHKFSGPVPAKECVAIRVQSRLWQRYEGGTGTAWDHGQI